LLATAWKDIVAAVPRARWLMCGPDDPWLAEAVWPALKAAGLESSVVYAGRLDADNVFRYLAAGDLHVNPTLCEGLNVVSIEAAAVGTPTITSDGAGISDWLVRYDAGAVVPRLKVEPLADAIIGALRDAAKVERWGRNGPAMADEFLLERIAPAMQRLLA
jgi:glycosyltransferase involved in cell wall biosynthesis